jgi:uncharacterized membrane protein YeaQ/YmgE (transglycosylase-associated protein family)
MGLVLALIVGGIVGWLASLLMKTDEQMGIIANVLVGVVGSAIGQFLFAILGFAAHGLIAGLIVGVVGAAVLIAALRAIGIYE